MSIECLQQNHIFGFYQIRAVILDFLIPKYNFERKFHQYQHFVQYKRIVLRLYLAICGLFFAN